MTIESLPDRRRILLRLKRAAGQLRAVEQLVESGSDSDCEAVVQQLSACRRALDKAFIEILACAMTSTAPGAVSEPDGTGSTGADLRVAEVADLLRRYG